MLKRIQTQDLTLGMFLHELCGSWMEHPLWRTRFLLTDTQDLHRIKETAIQECWIDASKGIDVQKGTASVSREEADARIDHDFDDLDTDATAASGVIQIAENVHDHTPTTFTEELKVAVQICRESKSAMMTMFNEARMGNAVDETKAQIIVDKISESVKRNPHALISLARLKTVDDYTYMHSVAVCALMASLARQLQMDEPQVRLAGMAGLLHDLGKAIIPLEILNKPGSLTDDEFSVVRQHPNFGYEILQNSEFIHEGVLNACLHHHEKINGKGYPDRLKGDEISLMAKMAAVCDVYDAITSNRPYKAGWDPAESLRRMAEWAPDHFDKRVFHAFVKSIGIYPIGSLVQLHSGNLAVVIEQSEDNLTTPIVKVFFSTKLGTLVPEKVIDLSKINSKDKIINREDPEIWDFPHIHELWSNFSDSKKQDTAGAH